jgi:pyruvate dehydrogenase E2 component (dihydrolipoamide acetyltransferase)
MPIEILMPALSPTMKEGNLAKWLKKEGDQIKAGEVIAEIETDKATMEVEAVDEGRLGKIIIPSGSQNVLVNSLIALILENGEDAKALDGYDAAVKLREPSLQEAVCDKIISGSIGEQPNPIRNYTYVQNSSRIFASPLARRIAEQNNVNLTQVQGTGPSGRIVKKDVLNFGSSVQNVRNATEYVEIPNNNIRKIIAKKLTESKQQIPHFYLSIECNLDTLLKARAALNEVAGEKYKLSVNDFIIKASAMALRDVPEANASWSEAAILRYNNVDISVAVAIDGGLITPIIKNADQKSMQMISNEMKDLAKRARENKLVPEEFQGGSFSISNLGMFGVKKFNAIINPPQSCILAVGANSERAIVDNCKIIVANMVDFTLSCDHRVVDGAVGAKFLAAFKKYIENPILFIV